MISNPRRVDAVTVDHLADLLAVQRRLEDKIGSALLVVPTLAQVDIVERLLREAPDNEVKVQLVDVGAQWAQFVAWLCETTGDHSCASRWYGRSIEWATEIANPDLVATVLNMRGHMAWATGNTRAMIGLSRAAQWQPAALVVRAIATQQEARGLATVGQARAADERLARAADLVAETAERRAPLPPWLYFYDPAFFGLQRALVDQYLSRHEQAVARLVGGLAALSDDIRESDWIGWYVLRLAASHAATGEPDEAVRAMDEARRIADATGAARLLNGVEDMATKLGL